jgi:hypothetical protein
MNFGQFFFNFFLWKILFKKQAFFDGFFSFPKYFLQNGENPPRKKIQ